MRKARVRTAGCKHGNHEGHGVCFFVSCSRCGNTFVCMRAVAPGQLYCTACSAVASRERKGKAHRTYYGSPDGQEQRRDEERERRQRLAEKHGAVAGSMPDASCIDESRSTVEPQTTEGSMGDRRPGQQPDGLQVAPTAFPPVGGADQEPCGGSTLSATPSSASTDPPSSDGAPASSGDDATAAQAAPDHEFEWTMVAWPDLLAAARERLGTLVACPVCGRSGIVTEVATLDEWYRRSRHPRAE